MILKFPKTKQLTHNELNEQALERAKSLLPFFSTEQDLFDLLLILVGVETANSSGLTPNASQLAQVRQYCKTNGNLQSIISSVFDDTTFLIEHDYTSSSSLFPEFIPDLLALYHQLQDNGYLLLNNILSPSIVSRLEDLYSSTEGWSGDFCDNTTKSLSKFDYNTPPPGFVRCFKSIPSHEPVINSIISDKFVQFFVHSYLNCKPKVIRSSVSISYPSDNYDAVDQAAQRFHFDLDSMKWLKMFIYLSDVTMDNGPHTCYPGTHKACAKSQRLLDYGYARIDNSDIASEHGDPTYLIGSKGSLIFADTHAFHKGLPLLSGSRKLLQIYFGGSIFAESYG